MDEYIIGKQWIACLEARDTSESGVIIVIDTLNNWSERRIEFPCFLIENFAMYEPPEGGVEEMLRMRSLPDSDIEN